MSILTLYSHIPNGNNLSPSLKAGSSVDPPQPPTYNVDLAHPLQRDDSTECFEHKRESANVDSKLVDSQRSVFIFYAIVFS